MPDLSGYQDWLQNEGYQPSTIESTLRHLRKAASIGGWDTRGPHLRRYLLFVKKTRKQPLGREFSRELKNAGYEPAAEIVKQGSTAKKPLTKKQWANLRARLRRGDSNGGFEGKLLAAYMESPYRVGDFLKLKIAELGPDDTDAHGLKWLKSVQSKRDKKVGKHMRVYEVLCPTERCTYARLRKHLTRVGEAMDMDVDLDTLYKSYFEVRGE